MQQDMVWSQDRFVYVEERWGKHRRGNQEIKISNAQEQVGKEQNEGKQNNKRNMEI